MDIKTVEPPRVCGLCKEFLGNRRSGGSCGIDKTKIECQYTTVCENEGAFKFNFMLKK